VVQKLDSYRLSANLSAGQNVLPGGGDGVENNGEQAANDRRRYLSATVHSRFPLCMLTYLRGFDGRRRSAAQFPPGRCDGREREGVDAE